MYSLSVSNFQSIKKSNFNFEGFSVICGKSNLGKSAVRRALQTILFNEWDKSYIRTYTKETHIEFAKDSELLIKCDKSSTKNAFNINGVEIPKIAKAKPEISTHKFSRDFNIASQLDSLFMVAWKQTDITKLLNDLFGVELLESAQRLCGLDLSRAKTLNKQLSQDIEISKVEVESLSASVNKLESLINRYDTIANKVNLIAQYQTTHKDFETHKSNLLYIKDKIASVELLFNHTKDLQKQLKLLNIYIHLSKEIQSLQVKKAKIPELDLSHLKGIKHLKRYIELCNNIKEFKQSIETIKRGIVQVDSEIAKVAICPTCKRPIG